MTKGTFEHGLMEKLLSWKEGEGEDQARHRSLVAWVIRMRLNDRDKAVRWLKGWNDKHPGSILERDVLSQWHKGNRGQPGDWK